MLHLSYENEISCIYEQFNMKHFKIYAKQISHTEPKVLNVL